MNEITLFHALQNFFSDNEDAYYLITDLNGYCTLLRVDDLDQQTENTEEFILDSFDGVTFAYRKGDDRLEINADGNTYYLIPYGEGVVSI